jgi:hypothetical protein
MKRSLVIVGVVMVIVCIPSLLSQNLSPGASMLIGTWQQNMEKSVYDPGPPPFKGTSSVRQYAAGKDGAIVAVTMSIDSQGLPSLGAISAANYDSKEYVQHTLATLATSLSSHLAPQITRTISYKPIDTYTVEIVQKQDGEVVSVSTRTISRDGRMMTERFDYTNAQGQRIRNVLVFDKR